MLVSEANDISMTEVCTQVFVPTLKWKKGDLIGEGAYAKVYQGMNIETGELIAIKRYKFSDDPKKVEREFISMRKEIKLLNDLNHPNIVNYF
jgi:serine/threonine protein kinase